MKQARPDLPVDPGRAFAILTTRLIWLFNVLYRLADNRIGVGILRTLIRWVWGQGLADLIDRELPDLVVSTHSFFSPSTHCPTRHCPRWITVVTDLGTPQRVWLDPRNDALIVQTPVIAEYACRRVHVPDNRIVALNYDYPIDPRFQEPVGPRARTWTILILGGGVGAGEIPAQVSWLRRCLTLKIIVVCGFNQRLKAELSRRPDDNVEVHGFVERLDELMRQADIVVTKAGPATIAEAAVMRKPLVITGWVGLQEQDNVTLVVKQRLGIYCPNAQNLPAAIGQIYQDYDAFCQGDQLFRPGGAKIARSLLSFGQS